MRTRRSGIILTLATVLAVTLLDVGGTANADPQGDEPPTMAEKKLAEELSSESLQTEEQPVQEIEQLSAARKAAAAKEVRLTSNGAWSWYMDPRVLESSRATYLGYVARSGSVMLTSVRHSDSLMTTTTLRARQERDDHNAPALVQTPGRKIVAFWAGHALAPVRYRISRGADDISAMSATRSLKGSGLENAPATYVQVFYLRGSGRPYHLLTRRDSDRMWMLTTSKDLRTWSKAVEVIKRPSWDVDTWPYVEATSDGWRRIHLTMTDGHPSDDVDTSLSHMYYRTDDHTLRRSSGSVITTLSATRQRPANPRLGTTIYNGRSVDGRVRVYDVALAAGRPAVVFTTIDRSVSVRTYTHKWSRLGYDGRWKTYTLARRRGSPRGLAIDSGDGYKVHLVNGVGGDDQVHELNTPDHGRTWTATPISGAASDLRNPTSPWGAAQKFSVLWMKGRYDGFRDFRTGIRGSTTGLVPVTLGMSVPSDWRRTGRITGIARQGIGGPREAWLKVWLLVKEPGGKQRWVRSETTSSTGRVSVPVNRFYKRGTTIRLYTSGDAERGAAYSSVFTVR